MRNTIKIIFLLSVFFAFAASLCAQEGSAIAPKNIEVDRNYDGVPDRFEYYDTDGKILCVETDTDFNGKVDEWVYYKNGAVEKAEKDTNGDGKPDTRMAY